MPGMPGQKIVVLPFAFNFYLETAGVASGSQKYVDVDLPEAEDWGPYIEAITAHTMVANTTATGAAVTTNYRWNIYVQWALDDKTWSARTPIVATDMGATENDLKIQAEFTTRMGRKIRFSIGAYNSQNTGSANNVYAWVTVALVFRFRS